MKGKDEKLKKISDEILEYLIAVIIILNTNSVYVHIANINLHFNILLVLVLAIYILKNIIWKKNIKNTVSFFSNELIKYYKYLIAYGLYLIIFFIFNRIAEKSFLTNYLFILPMFIYIFISNKRIGIKILKKIVNIVLVLSIISLIFYFLISIIKVLSPNMIIEVDWGGINKIDSFCNVYFKMQKFNFRGIILDRNTGVFTEAPMFSLILCIALAIKKFILKNNKLSVEVILVITTLTTFSTTGIIALSIIYTYKLITKAIEKGSLNRRVKVVIIICIAFLLIIAGSAMIKRIRTSSGSIRIDDYIACYKSWKDSPIFGNGYCNNKSIEKYMSQSRKYNTGLSNSIMVLLAQCGIYLFILYSIPCLYIIRTSIKTKKYNIFMFNIIIAFLFITTIFMYTPIMIYLLGMSYAYMIKNLLLKRKEDGDNKRR